MDNRLIQIAVATALSARITHPCEMRTAFYSWRRACFASGDLTVEELQCRAGALPERHPANPTTV